MKVKYLRLSFNATVLKIMTQRKNTYMKKNKLKKLSWSDFIKIKVLS